MVDDCMRRGASELSDHGKFAVLVGWQEILITFILEQVRIE